MKLLYLYSIDGVYIAETEKTFVAEVDNDTMDSITSKKVFRSNKEYEDYFTHPSFKKIDKYGYHALLQIKKVEETDWDNSKMMFIFSDCIRGVDRGVAKIQNWSAANRREVKVDYSVPIKLEKDSIK